MHNGKKPFIALGVFLCIAIITIGVFFFTNSPGVFTVTDKTPAAPTSTKNNNANATSPTAYPALNIKAYNAKLLAIANLPPPITATSVTTVATASGTIHIATTTVKYVLSRDGVPLKDLWPVPTSTAPYPTNGGALLPFDRIVAYYGNLYSTQMGVLGEYPTPQMLAMLASTTAEWQAADPSTPTIPALDYIAVAAQASAGPDGKYRLRMPDSQIDKILQMANQIHGIVFIDIQVGLSTVQQEVPVFEKYLEMPNVELALDPEFDMHNGQRPGTVIGTMDAADINWAAQYLANLVKEYDLAPKLLVVHRFTEPMVTNANKIQPLPQVQIIMDMDGFGPPAQKMTTYRDFIQNEPVQFTGFKLFYKNDIRVTGSHLMTPQEVLKLTPQPSYIQYE